MAPIGTPTFIPSATVTVTRATNARVTNLVIGAAATEVSHALIAKLGFFMLAARNDAVLNLTFTALESGTKYVTIPKGVVYSQGDLDFNSKTMYLQANKACVVEIIEYYS